MEIVFPLCVHLGVTNIITNGWVGGPDHGIKIENEEKWEKYPYLWAMEARYVKISEKLPKFLLDHFGINIFTICDSSYNIKKIDEQKYINIISN